MKGPSRTVDVDIDGHTIGRAVVEFVPEEEGKILPIYYLLFIFVLV